MSARPAGSAPAPQPHAPASAVHTNQLYHSQGTMLIGRIAGIPVHLHALFFIATGLALLAQYGETWWHFLWAGVLFGPVLLITVLLHELGHCLATRMIGAEVHSIMLWPLGGLAFVGHAGTPLQDLFVAVAGPLMHLPQFAAWFLLTIPASQKAYGHIDMSLRGIPDPSAYFWLALTVGACQMNIGLAAFNLLLPAYPLDGGRVLADLLLLCRMNEVLAAKITASLAVLCAVGLGVWAVLSLSILSAAVAVWMLVTTWDLIKAIRAGTVRLHPMFCYEQLPAQRSENRMLPPGTQYSAQV